MLIFIFNYSYKIILYQIDKKDQHKKIFQVPCQVLIPIYVEEITQMYNKEGKKCQCHKDED